MITLFADAVHCQERNDWSDYDLYTLNEMLVSADNALS